MRELLARSHYTVNLTRRFDCIRCLTRSQRAREVAATVASRQAWQRWCAVGSLRKRHLSTLVVLSCSHLIELAWWTRHRHLGPLGTVEDRVQVL